MKTWREHLRVLSPILWVVWLTGCSSPSLVEPVRSSSEYRHSPYQEPFSGKDLTGWRMPIGEWTVAGGVESQTGDPKALRILDGSGVLVNGPTGRTVNLLSEMEHGDVELSLEFLVPEGSNSGVYLQGRYEVQIRDSWQHYEPTFADCGGIYQRWIDQQGFEGQAPRVNASLPAGEWQRFDITFRAPRFDSLGRKVEDARFVQVLHNGVVIHENVSVSGPTRSASFINERALGPIMLQGDHGPVAYRNLIVRQVVLP